MKLIKLFWAVSILFFNTSYAQATPDWAFAFKERFAGVFSLIKANQNTKPYDFNGDNKDDYLFVVQVIDSQAAQQFDTMSMNLNNTPAITKGQYAIVVMHSINEPNPKITLITDTEQGSYIQQEHMASQVSVADHASVLSWNDETLIKSQGDAIVVPTPASINTYLYFYNDQYHYYQPLEIP